MARAAGIAKPYGAPSCFAIVSETTSFYAILR
jgi:hypothetical protein